MQVKQPTTSRPVTLGSARAATKALGGTKAAESNMVFRYD